MHLEWARDVDWFWCSIDGENNNKTEDIKYTKKSIPFFLSLVGYLEYVASLWSDNLNHLPEVRIEVLRQPLHPLRRHHRLRKGCETRNIGEKAHRVIFLSARKLLICGPVSNKKRQKKKRKTEGLRFCGLSAQSSQLFDEGNQCADHLVRPPRLLRLKSLVTTSRLLLILVSLKMMK